MKPKIKTRIGTREESLKYYRAVAQSMPVDAACIGFRDRHPEAVRIIFNRETGDPLYQSDQITPRICAPWLMAALSPITFLNERHATSNARARIYGS